MHNYLESFVPRARLDYGMNLGDAFKEGLATNALWNMTSPKTATQNGTWQAGAIIYAVSGEEEEEEEWPANVTRIFPNPAMGVFYVLMSDPDNQYGIAKVYDSFGRFVFSRPVNFGLNPIEVPVSMPSGLYTVTLEAATVERFIRKVIIIN